jgi:hypothetical protein
MNEGLLWFDADPKRPAQEKLDAATARFAERFRRAANCCHVHPSQQFAHPKIHVVGDTNVLPNHLWVGRDETLPRPRRPRPSPAAPVREPTPLRPKSATRSTASARPNRRPAKESTPPPAPATPGRPLGRRSPAEPAPPSKNAETRAAAVKPGRTVAKPAAATVDPRPVAKAALEPPVVKQAPKRVVPKQAAKKAVAQRGVPKETRPDTRPATARARPTPPANDREQATTPRRSPARGPARRAADPARRPDKTLRRPA